MPVALCRAHGATGTTRRLLEQQIPDRQGPAPLVFCNGGIVTYRNIGRRSGSVRNFRHRDEWLIGRNQTPKGM
jgi:hypothetical protein